jgi:hypothetical protein
MDTKMLVNAVSKSKPVQHDLEIRHFNVDGFDMDHLQIAAAADIEFKPYQIEDTGIVQLPQEDNFDCGGDVEEFFQNL